MKRILNTFLLTLFALMMCAPGAMALDEIQPPASEPTELGPDHYLELTVTEDHAEEVQVFFTEQGSESELQIEDLLDSTLWVSLFQELLINNNIVKSPLDVPFSLRKDGDAFVMKLKDPEVFGIYKAELAVNLDGDEKPVNVDAESEIVLVAPEGSLAVIHDPADENVAADDPIAVTETAKGYIQSGDVEIHFVILPAPGDDNGNTDENPDQPDNGDFPASASGGCSLIAAAGGGSGAGALFLSALALLGGIRFHKNR